MTTKQKVEAAKSELTGKSRKELYAWAESNGINSKSAWGFFKRALKEVVGFDWSEAKAADVAAVKEELAGASTMGLTLFTDAKARTNRFAICDSDGQPVWHGRFFDDDRDGYNGEQSSGELACALKAIWLARQAANAAGQGAVALHLKVDAQWLCSLSGKAKAIAEKAVAMRVSLTMEWVPGDQNPADKFTVCGGYMRWSDRNLADLVKPATDSAEVAL